jgi:hypothetical protein
MDLLKELNAFYAAYLEYFGAEADEVTPENMDAKDRATIAGLKAVLELRAAA